MLLMRDLERAARHLSRGSSCESYATSLREAFVPCMPPWESLHRVPISNAFRLVPQVSSDDRRRAPFRSLDQALLQSYHPVWPCQREIHSSEWRKPSEISLRLRMVLSYPASGHAPVLMSRCCFGRESGQRVLDLRRGVCTVRQQSRAVALRAVMETRCSSSTWTRVLTRSPPSNFNEIITKPVYAVSYTTLVTTT
jgi:hypothetical protein